MKLQIGENKTIDIKYTSGIKYSLYLAEDSPFHHQDYVIDIHESLELIHLLQKYDDKDIEFILFNDVFFIYFPQDNFCFYANFPENYIEHIKKFEQIIFVIAENNIEYFLAYDKIFK